ncbi:MAG: YceI family protein [Acidimicrobiia bacterium]
MTQTQQTPEPQSVLAPGIWEIDPVHTNVEFVARHLLSRVRGRFRDFSGQLVIAEDPTRSSVDVTIEAASVDTGNADRDAHLRSPDFLHVERFPTLAFRGTATRPGTEPGHYLVDGDLTIRDVTRPVTLEVEYHGWSDDPWGGQRAAFSAMTEVQRTDFGADWNVVVETGGLLVGKTVRIELEVEAIRKGG